MRHDHTSHLREYRERQITNAAKERVDYLEARIEQLSLHSGHVQVNDYGKSRSLRDWAESVIRGDPTPPAPDSSNDDEWGEI